MRLWIARDKAGFLWVYTNKPSKEDAFFLAAEGDPLHKMMNIDETEFPEITFENSPQQVELKLIEENDNMDMD